MNYNNLYRKKDWIKPKRNAEERRNINKIMLGALMGMAGGVAVMGLIVLLIHLF